LRITDHRAGGHGNERVLAVFTMHLLPSAAAAVRRLEYPLELEMGEGLQIRFDDKDYVTALAAVSSVGTAARNVLLPPKGYGPVSPFAGRDDDRSLIHEAVHEVSVLDGLDCDEIPSLLVMEDNISVHEREQGVVAAPPHQLARVELGPPLPDYDRSRAHRLARIPFDPQSLGLRITPVLRGAALLASHFIPPSFPPEGRPLSGTRPSDRLRLSTENQSHPEAILNCPIR